MNLTNFQSIWTPVEKYLKEKKIRDSTIKDRYYSFKILCDNTDIQEIKDLGNTDIAKEFLAVLDMKNLKDNTKRNHLSNISSTVERLIEQQVYEKIDYGLEIEYGNPYKYLLKSTFFEDDKESHKTRSKTEVELWVGLIPRLEIKVIWALAAMGLRKFEIWGLKRSQFDLKKRAIKNVKRKGRKTQKRIGLPLWIIPLLEKYFKRLDKDESLVQITYTAVTIFFKRKYMRDLSTMLTRLTSNPDLMERYEKVIDPLEDILENGNITLHALRATWDTLAAGKMEDIYRRFHLNHALKGSDETYVQIANNDQKFKEYLKDLDENGPHFDLEGI